MERLRTLFILCPLIFSGCTNVAGDITRSIHHLPSSSLSSDTLFAAAGHFFTNLGYQCDSNHQATRFRCTKALRDVYIHQTRAVVQIYPGDAEVTHHSLFTTRWDEGLIPGEFISSEFTNPDVAAFCDYLREDELGLCRSGDE
ncbi:MAG: hypothetical protein R3175_13665 [Marinobacter sp.]|uniref:hypothetical protein n=1 Tax=Marinobacter sp. TaxID=50741 RepID=UPI00299E5141|nr:hypothetical protein [Marinobacter sp.]MDX1757104.1 hypothetical protein [Marinobacter sp.]